MGRIVFESDSWEAKETVKKLQKHEQTPCMVAVSKEAATHTQKSTEKGGVKAWSTMLSLSAVDILITTAGAFSAHAAALGPGMIDSRRVLKFEDFLAKRHALGVKSNV